MKKTGQLLKEAREAKSISLQEVSIHLKINTKTLKALESGDKAQLPAKTFLRGFVQSYAQYLKLDLNQVMEVFQEEMGTTHPSMITTQVAQPPTNYHAGGSVNTNSQNNSIDNHFQSIPKTSAHNDKKPASTPTFDTQSKTAKTQTVVAQTPKTPINEPVPPNISFDPQTWSHSLKIGATILVLIIVSVIIGVKKTIDKYEKEATLPKQSEQTYVHIENADSAVTNAITTTATLATSEGTTGKVESTPSPQTSNINAGSSGLQNMNISQEALTLTSKPQNLAGTTTGTTTGATTIAANTSPVPSPSITGNLEFNPQEVIIEALDKVVIEYSIDGGPKTSLSLIAEKIHTFKAKKNITLSFSDGGSVNLIHNGKDKGVPGNLGQPVIVSFPK